MIINGDAIEIKKVGTKNPQIALNSSYPSAKLFSNSSKITSVCRNCEKSSEKDIIYVIGTINKNNDIKIKLPDNPIKLIPAKLISYQI